MGSIYTIEVPSGHRLKVEADTPEQALEAANGWNPATFTPAQRLEDVAKSAAIGPPSAVIGAAGAAGGLRNMLSGATDVVGEAMGASPEGVQKFKNAASMAANLTGAGSVIANAPDAGTIQKKVEQYTGPLYQPKTPEGGYAKSVTENVTGALIGPGGIPSKIAQGVASGLGSEALGNYFKGTLEPYARFVGGLAGGIGATGGAHAVQRGRNAMAAAETGQNIGGIIGGGSVKGAAVDRVARNLADEEITVPQAAARAQELGPNSMVLDLGHQLENRADFMAQHSGKAQNTIYKPIAERAEGIAPQLNAVLDKHMGPSQNVVALQNGIEEWSRQNVGPLYKNLEAKYPVVNDARLAELAERPSIKSAMGNAENIAKDMGETVSGAQPSIAYWDFVKKSMDHRISNMMKGADDSSAAMSTMQAVMQARKDLIHHLDNITGGEYAQARKLAATKPAMEEALDLGRSVFANKMLPEQLADHLNGLSLAERKMVEMGVRREIEHRVGTPGDEGRKLRALIGAPNNAAKLEHLLGSAANKEIQNEIAAADQFQRVANKIEGTRTATRTAGMNDTTAPTFNQNPTVLGAAAALPRMGINYALEHGMSGTRNDISRILTAKGGKIDPIVQQLLNYNTKKAEQAASPLKEQAAALIRALIAGGVSR